MHGFAIFMPFFSLLIHPTGQQYDTQHLGQINKIHPSALDMKSACNHSKTRNHGKIPILVSPHLIMQQLPNLSFSTTHLFFILNITAGFYFFSIKTDKVTWKTKKIRHFLKMANARLNNFKKMLMSSNHVLTPTLTFSQ